LRVDGAIDGGSLTRLADQSRGLDEITLQFRLDKERLASARYAVPPGCRAVLYFYPDAFDSLLRAPPRMRAEEAQLGPVFSGRERDPLALGHTAPNIWGIEVGGMLANVEESRHKEGVRTG
jgi:hypothetical protein